MDTLIVAVLAFVGFIVAYHTYGRWLARRIFQLDAAAEVPSKQLRDDVDYIPTKKEVIFGHHFTSIAGTGPIVGPAIAVFWGWLPALLWVVVGSIFIGAVHDFGALIVSLRNRGQTVGEIAGRMITPRARFLFLIVLCMALTVVLAIFGLVIASIFASYPETVLSVWIEIPCAIAIGFWVYRRGGGLLAPSILALMIMYGCIYIGAYHFQVDLKKLFSLSASGFWNPTVIWTLILLSYCAVASVLPVWVLLQPRDFINSHQLVLALGLLVLGVVVAGATGQTDLSDSAPAITRGEDLPAFAPPIWPFLFITIACGAVSGFHCLVSSGTSSKQVASEQDAQYVGYGAMLLEGALAVLVILACCAGVGMGKFDRISTAGSYDYQPHLVAGSSEQLTGQAAWKTRYDAQKGWSAFGLGAKVGAFIEGGANFLGSLAIPIKLGIGIVAVLVASFAATTLDTATRLQRYVIQELLISVNLKPLANKYLATAIAVVLGGLVAMIPAPGTPAKPPGTGGLILWPLFGATNQLLAGLALMVTVFYLWRRSKPILFALIPMLVMLVMPAWAMLWQMFNTQIGPDGAATGWWWKGNYLLFGFGLAILGLQIWMMIEALLLWPRAKGVVEESLPPLRPELRVQS